MVYTSMTILTLIFAGLLQKYEKSSVMARAGLSMGVFLPMYLVNSFMFYTGNDYSAYYESFKMYQNGEPVRFEPGYKLVNKLVIFLGLDFQWVYIILCCAGYGLLLTIVFRYSRSYAYTLFLYIISGYFFLLGMNALRMFIAVGVISWSYRYLIERRLIPFLVCTMIATLFHTSALIMLPIYYLLNWKLKLSFFVTLAVLVIPIHFFSKPVLHLLLSGAYASTYVDGAYFRDGFRFDFIYVLSHFIPAAVIFWYHKKGYEDREDIVFTNASIWGLTTVLLFSWFPEYERIAYLFMIPVFCFLPKVLLKEKNITRRWACGALIAVSFGLSTLWRIQGWGVFPYKSVFGLIG